MTAKACSARLPIRPASISRGAMTNALPGRLRRMDSRPLTFKVDPHHAIPGSDTQLKNRRLVKNQNEALIRPPKTTALVAAKIPLSSRGSDKRSARKSAVLSMLASFTYVGACEENHLCGPLFQLMLLPFKPTPRLVGWHV